MIAIAYTAPVDGYLTLPDAARRLGMTRAVLWRHVKAGRLAGVERAGHIYLLPETEVERFGKVERKTGRPRKDKPPAAPPGPGAG